MGRGEVGQCCRQPVGGWRGLRSRAELVQEGQAAPFLTCLSISTWMPVVAGEGLVRVAPFSHGSPRKGPAAALALGKIHPFVLQGDLGNAEGTHDSNLEVFILLGPLWTSQGTRKARCRCLLSVRGAKC